MSRPECRFSLGKMSGKSGIDFNCSLSRRTTNTEREMMFRGVSSSHCRFVPEHLQVALALSHQAVPEGMRIAVCHGAGKESLGFSSFFFPTLLFKIKSHKVPPLGFAGVSCRGCAQAASRSCVAPAHLPGRENAAKFFLSWECQIL